MHIQISGLAALLAVGLAGAAKADHLNIMLDGATSTGDVINVPGVLIDQPGFLVVHAMTADGPVVPASIGHTMLAAGMSEDVGVTIEGGLMAGTTYMLMLHYDTDGDGIYSFGEGMTDVDTPALKADGSPYTTLFMTPAM